VRGHFPAGRGMTVCAGTSEVYDGSRDGTLGLILVGRCAVNGRTD
jgi:hypothetical protein